MSDMHTETFETAAHNNHPTVHTVNPTGGAEYLILAGDMGSPHTSKSRTLYETTLQRLATAGRFRRVFFIAGNHEFHGSSCTAASAAAPRARVAAAAAATSTPFTFLNRTRINDLIPEHNVIILGCTLWSDIPTHPPEVAAHVYDNLKDAGDFHHIRLQPQNARGSHRLTVSEYNELHGRDRAWLEAELDDIWRTYRTSNDCDAGVIPGHPHAEPPRVVVITHHAPLMRWTSHPRFESAPVPRPMQHAFGTDLHQMFGGDRVSVWCYGHTHYSVDFTLHGTRVVANQVGYAQNQDRDGVVGFQGYDASKVFVA
ncbi:Metallo-dependent phosphatase-like protein [Zopfochytrium polystomum]|nr:Metallo-dependent phosphatase-like protein [Zopfochytrium polystomum]